MTGGDSQSKEWETDRNGAIMVNIIIWGGDIIIVWGVVIVIVYLRRPWRRARGRGSGVGGSYYYMGGGRYHCMGSSYYCLPAKAMAKGTRR